jgi:rhomboid family GlyGly-CTERM serine protease
MTESDSLHIQTWRQEATARVLGLFILSCLLLSAVNHWVWPAATQSLRYEREGVLSGQLWRLVTAHLVHGNAQHLLLNVLGTVVIAGLFPRTYRIAQWVIVLAMSGLFIDAALVALEPGLEWYLGASGVLHGALAAGATAWWRTGRRRLAVMLGVILFVKLGWEQWQGALPLATGLPVLENAHLYGACGGVVGSALVLCRWRPFGHSPRASL